MVEKRSNMQLSDLNSKPSGIKSLRDIIYRAVVSHFYTHPGSKNYTLLFLNRFHGSTQINDKHSKNDERKTT